MCDEKHYLFSSVQQKQKKEKTTYKLKIFGNNLAIFDNGRKRNMRTNSNQSICMKENLIVNTYPSVFGVRFKLNHFQCF